MNTPPSSPSSPIPLMVTPIRMVRPFAASIETPEPGNGPVKRGRGRPKGSKNRMSTKKPKIQDPSSRKVSSLSNFNSEITEEERESGNEELVDLVYMRYDAVRRRLCQLGISENLSTALSNCVKMGVRTNMKKRIGSVPGVNVGDMYFYYGEMCLVGLHKQTTKGIDYLRDEDGAIEGPLATSVVSSGHYDDKRQDLETLIYTGTGKKGQELRGGNLALVGSKTKGNDVRVILGEKDPNNKDQKIFIYDGLYNVSDYETIKNEKSGFTEYKFRLVRKPGQPSGYAVWKSIEKWRKNDSRKRLQEDISRGGETAPIPVINEIDENDKSMPRNFSYIASQYDSSGELVFTDHQILGCQNHQAHLCSNDSDCKCLERNDNKVPYVNGRILVCRKLMIYECGNNCKFKVVQEGIKIRLEVFKTKKCGWGLRSWDPIRAGTFICEFVGESKTKHQVEQEESNDYLFDSSRAYIPFKWNYEPELVVEDSGERVPEVFNLPYQVLISARKYGNVGRFINHSCSPNLFWQPIEYVKDGESYVRIAFFAKKNIPPMTELTYDYGMARDEVEEDGRKLFKWRNVCVCGSVKCRGSFG